MAVIARDSVAADQLVFVWPFPISGGAEVSCNEDEVVVMCPAWVVGDKLGPGRHAYRAPDPSKPVGAYFVLTAPVEIAFDMMSSFIVPTTQQPVRIRATGSVLVRAGDPGLLVAQFVGLPFENLNLGLVRSVSASVARLLSRVLVRRVVMTGTPLAVTDPSMMGSILEELVAYNPTAGAVFGLELVRVQQLDIHADDGGQGWEAHASSSDWRKQSEAQQASGQHPSHSSQPAIIPPPDVASAMPSSPSIMDSGVRPGRQTDAAGLAGRGGSSPSVRPPDLAVGSAPGVVSGEIGVVSGEINPRPTTLSPQNEPLVLTAGSRVLVAGPDGRLHAAVVRQHMQGYYELEIGATGETVWVPETQVLPDA